ncbi:MAG: DUF998 domain-containing protein [bacterium]
MATKKQATRDGRRAGRRGNPAAAGALLFAVGLIAVLGIITAEALYPGYSTSANEISDLGATPPPQSLVVQPSATIFNTTMMVCGALVILAAFFLYRAFRSRAVAISTGLFGVGALGVGVFPGNYGDLHAGFALLTFIAAAVAAILAYKVETAPFRYFSVVLGAVSLVVLALYFILGDSHPLARLGSGGIERWVAYPILLWVTGFGGYLLGRSR